MTQGSGKTFTMGGGDISAQDEEDFGIIPRAIHEIFDLVQVTFMFFKDEKIATLLGS